MTAGAEPAQVARWSQLYKQKKPVLFYWYTPQYLNQEYDLAEVKLPPRKQGEDCKDDAKAGGDPEQYKCEYDVTVINKLFSKKFADSGSPAYEVLKKMKLTNEDQEQVAKAIAGRQGGSGEGRRRTGSRTTATRSTPGSARARERDQDAWIYGGPRIGGALRASVQKRGRQLRAQARELGQRGRDVAAAPLTDLVLEVGPEGLFLAETLHVGQGALGLQLHQVAAGVGGGHA